MRVYQTVPTSVVDHAVYYIETLGMGLCSFSQGTKGPNQSGWNQPGLYIDTIQKAVAQINDSNNIGDIHSSSGTAAIDVDHLEWCRLMFQEFGLDIDQYLNQGLQITSGRPNRGKAVFRIPSCLADCTMFKINWPHPDTGLPECVIEFRVGNVQDVLPPSIHPETKQPYRWVVPPWECGNVIPEMPHELVQFILHKDKFRQQLIDACPWVKEKKSINAPPKEKPANAPTNNVITLFNEAHDLRTMLESYGYQRKGKRHLAPNSSTRIAGIVLFEGEDNFYSHHGSDVFADGKRHDSFDIFCQFNHSGNVRAAVSDAANLLGIAPQPKPSPNQVVSRAEQKPAKSNTIKIHEPNLSPIPGVLGECVKWINESSTKPQPLFAMQAALAFGSVVLGRKYESNNRNLTSLYFLNIGKTGSGKEHAKTVIEELLEAADLAHLIGPGRYSSEAGLLSTLIEKPTCISVMDEFGKMMDATKVQGNYMSRDVLKSLMELWGRLDGTMRSTGYATAALTEKQREDLANRIVKYPALTVLGMSTPESFYAAISSGQVADGFLNRIIVAHSEIGRQMSQFIGERKPIPESVIEWAKAMRSGLPDGIGNIEAIEHHSTKPPLFTIPFTHDAVGHFRHFEKYCMDRQDELESVALDVMYSRTREIAMRLSLIVALSCNSKVIEIEHAKWATDYVDELQRNNIDHMIGQLADSPFHALKNAVLLVIAAGGSKGRTHREITKCCRPYKAANPKMQDDVLNSLARDQDIQQQEIPNIANKGKKRIAWVAVDGDMEISGDE